MSRLLALHVAMYCVCVGPASYARVPSTADDVHVDAPPGCDNAHLMHRSGMAANPDAETVSHDLQCRFGHVGAADAGRSRMQERHQNSEYVHEALAQLILRRFDATAALTARLDERKDSIDPSRAGHFFALGLIKDPESIEWIRAWLKERPRREEVMCWLAGWTHLGGACFDDFALLRGRRAWCELFRWWIDAALKEDVPREWLSYAVMIATFYFHDDTMSQHLGRIEQADLSLIELAWVHRYAAIHGSFEDDVSLSAGLQHATECEAWDEVCSAARVLRDPVFVPYLIDILENENVPEHKPLAALGEITFEWGLKAPAEWRAWWSEHRETERSEWLVRAVRTRKWGEMSCISVEDIPERYLTAVCDCSLIGAVEDLAGEPACTDFVRRWIAIAYNPAYHERMFTLAVRAYPRKGATQLAALRAPRLGENMPVVVEMSLWHRRVRSDPIFQQFVSRQ